ncbi:hypothetical protein KKG66_01260 [bacterium]|nr:hypothetical protein [bacterium]
MDTVTDSLSLDGIVNYLESHTVIAVLALVVLIAVLIIVFKIARWVFRPVIKGVLAGGLVFAGLYFLAYKEILSLSMNWIILIAVVLFLVTAIIDLNRKE